MVIGINLFTTSTLNALLIFPINVINKGNKIQVQTHMVIESLSICLASLSSSGKRIACSYFPEQKITPNEVTDVNEAKSAKSSGLNIRPRNGLASIDTNWAITVPLIRVKTFLKNECFGTEFKIAT